MWAISTTNWNFQHFFPCETGGRKALKISICRRNCSQSSCYYFDFPLGTYNREWKYWKFKLNCEDSKLIGTRSRTEFTFSLVENKNWFVAWRFWILDTKIFRYLKTVENMIWKSKRFFDGGQCSVNCFVRNKKFDNNSSINNILKSKNTGFVVNQNNRIIQKSP